MENKKTTENITDQKINEDKKSMIRNLKQKLQRLLKMHSNVSVKINQV